MDAYLKIVLVSMLLLSVFKAESYYELKKTKSLRI